MRSSARPAIHSQPPRAGFLPADTAIRSVAGAVAAALDGLRRAGVDLALASPLAGNLLIVGSIANIIVVDQAARLRVRITWRTHAAVGVPVTLLTLAIASGWLWARWGW